MITFYTKPGCPYCVKAKQWFDERNIAYELHDLNTPEKIAEFKEANPELKTLPQIWVNHYHVGGYTDLIAHQEFVLEQLNELVQKAS
jgi:glutaredoxin